MKAIKLSIAWAVLLSASIALVGVTRAEAQTDRRLSATPRAFQAFYAKFRRAALRKDKSAVASMTSFPFEYGWDAGDEGTYSRRQFLGKFNDIFRETRKLFSQADPMFGVSGGSFDLTDHSDASHYIFAKKGKTYFFKAFIVEP